MTADPFSKSPPFADDMVQGEDAPSSDPLGDPPPYESIVMSSPNSSTPELSGTLRTSVTDPVRQGDGVSAYVSYKVATVTDLPGFASERLEVIRRFRDFRWLQGRLRSENRGVIVPPLPERSVVEKYKMNAEFIETRRAALDVFLTNVCEHPLLRGTEDLRFFLAASESSFAQRVSQLEQSSHASLLPPPLQASAAAHSVLSGAANLLARLGAGASALLGAGGASRRAADEQEDADYLRVRGYVYALEPAAAEAARQAARLVRHQRACAMALADFGGALAELAAHAEGGLAAGPGEEPGSRRGSPAAADLEVLSRAARAAARSAAQWAERAAGAVEAPLVEAQRSVRAAREAMEDRAAAVDVAQAAREAVASRRQRLARLRGTPGIREERVVDAERELDEAQRRAEQARAGAEAVARRMAAELPRWQAGRARRMGAVLAQVAQVHVLAAQDAEKCWRAVLAEEGA